MKFDLSISVVIPVYNAQAFLTRAVESALAQPETNEVILVEDSSSDDSLLVCQGLTQKYDRVKLFTHPANENRGAGPSRNLGMEKATQDYIAFLDADDFYLPDRFRAEREIFKQKPDTDGVYGALGFHYYSEAGRQKYQNQGFGTLTTVSAPVHPTHLFYVLLGLSNIRGYIHLDTLTIKKSVLNRTEKFGNLKLHQDTVFLIQLAYNCKLESGEITKPIALRGVHDHNRIVNNHKNFDSRQRMWKELQSWAAKNHVSNNIQKIFSCSMKTDKLVYKRRIIALTIFFSEIFKEVDTITYRRFFNRPVLYIFGRQMGGVIIKCKELIQKKIFNSIPYISFEKNHRKYV